MHNANTVRITDYFKINDENTNTQHDFNELLDYYVPLINCAKTFDDQINAYFASAFAYMGLGQDRAALPYIDDALAIITETNMSHEKHPLLHTMRASIYRILYDNDKVLQEARKGVLYLLKTDCLNTFAKSNIRAVYAYCYSVLAELLFIHEEFDEAAAYAEIARLIYREDPNAHWILAAIEQLRNDTIVSIKYHLTTNPN